MSLCITDIFGDFLSELRKKYRVIVDAAPEDEIRKFGAVSCHDNLHGNVALVLFEGKYFFDKRNRYLYGLCTGQVIDPIGFFFKWLQYEGEAQLDTKLYLAQQWKIVWIPHKLTPVEVKYLDNNLCLPPFTEKF